MAHYAPVVPIQIARILQHHNPAEDLFGGYHLILAHDVLDKPEDYRKVYDEVRRRYPDSFIILDNSIVELGKAMEIHDLLDAAEIVNPDCIVVPDAMGDGALTREMAKDFCNQYRLFAVRAPFVKPPLMGVLQGKTVSDCLQTYTVFGSLVGISLVSVPRIIVKQHGSRLPLLEELGGRYTFRNIHMLGFSDDLLDDITCARLSHVRGIDSAVPVRAGLQGRELTLDAPADYGPRGNFWEYDVMQLTTLMDSTIKRNIRNVRRWIEIPIEPEGE